MTPIIPKALSLSVPADRDTVMRLLSKKLIQRRKSVHGAHLRTWQLLRVLSFVRIDESKWKQKAKCQLMPHWLVANNAHLPSSIIFEGNGKLLKEQSKSYLTFGFKRNLSSRLPNNCFSGFSSSPLWHLAENLKSVMSSEAQKYLGLYKFSSTLLFLY